MGTHLMRTKPAFALVAALVLGLALCAACERQPKPTDPPQQPQAPAPATGQNPTPTTPSPQATVVAFSFTQQGMMMGPYYSIRQVGDEYLCATTRSKLYVLALEGNDLLEWLTSSEDGSYAYDEYAGGDPLGASSVYGQAALTQADLEAFTALLAEQGVFAWDGFDELWEPPAGFEVTDTGATFDLQVLLSDGTRVSAHGMDAYPDGYGEAVRAIIDFFETHAGWPE